MEKFRNRINKIISRQTMGFLVLDGWKLSIEEIKEVVDVLNNAHPEITILSLNNCWMDDRYVEEIMKLKYLRFICFDDNMFTEKGIEKLFSSKIPHVDAGIQIDKDYGNRIRNIEDHQMKASKNGKKRCVNF